MLIGKKFGRYEIREKIGAGGMGEVYLAHDAELERKVAVKILPSEFSEDTERKQRFRQEARAVSALNHPNIITIYEVGENEHGSFLTTEYIEGETLREFIKRQSPDIGIILRIVEQIAKALVAAHQAHIVHRDIKPENIMIRADGIVKVLDFGLAKPTIQKTESADESVNTIPGMVMGSARYMSPEQARGLPIDTRTDIWSLGVILYEMLTGNAPFNGATTSDTIAAVIYKEPAPIGDALQNAPPELNRIIRKSLQKDRDERYQNVKDFALDLKDLLYEIEHGNSAERRISAISENATMIHRTSSSDHPTLIHQTNSASHPTRTSVLSTSDLETSNQTPKKRGWKMWKISFAALAAFLLIGWAFSFYKKSGTKSAAAGAFEKNQVSRINSDGKVLLPAISPDGKYIAYVSGETGNRSLVVRQISTDSLITIVPPTNLDFRTISFSPAGDYIYYTQIREDFSLNTLYQVPTLGGTPKRLIEDVDSPVTFSPDGKRFAFVRHASDKNEDLIFIADTNDVNPQQFISSKETGFEVYSKDLAWSPDGTQILLGASKNQNSYNETVKLAEISVADKKLKILPSRDFYDASNFRWFKDGSGFLFSAQEKANSPAQIWRYDYRSGEAQPITNDFNYYTDLGLSADGQTIITIKGESVSSLWRFSSGAKELTQLTSDSRSLEGAYGLAQMPDGKLFYSKNDGRKIDFQIADADGKNPRNITKNMEAIYSPVPTPDGRYIVFSSQMSKTPRIWRMDADGKNAVQLSDENAGFADFNPQVTADGQTVVFERSNSDNRSSLFKVSIEGGQVSPFFDNEKWNINQPRLSPDGKLIAFTEYDINTVEKHIVIASLDGNSFGKIEKSLEYNLVNLIKWSPDSKSLTVSSNQAGVPNLFRLPLDESSRQSLTDFKSGKILNFAWSHDGKNLFIVRGITNNDLILISDSAIGAGK
ncbi:MAG: protein kinase [Acidobacteriota bacterium]|nr:protein kinase [Acidobacteriota bacterium]